MAFAEYLKVKHSTFQIRRSSTDTWFTFAIGRSGFELIALVSTDKQRVGVELIVRDPSKTAFRALFADKLAIEQEFGEPLAWRELTGGKSSRITSYRDGVDPADSTQYETLHAWTLDKLERFRKVFAPRIKALALAEATEDEIEAAQ